VKWQAQGPAEGVGRQHGGLHIQPQREVGDGLRGQAMDDLGHGAAFAEGQRRR